MRHCATFWKATSSIPNGVIAVFHRHNPSRNEYQEYFVVGKGSWCAGMITFPPSHSDYLEI